jgi:hypothetical protein
MSGRINGQIKQTKPLPSLETEAILNLFRTNSVVEEVCAVAISPAYWTAWKRAAWSEAHLRSTTAG